MFVSYLRSGSLWTRLKKVWKYCFLYEKIFWCIQNFRHERFAMIRNICHPQNQGVSGTLILLWKLREKIQFFFPKRDEKFLEVIFPMQNISGVINSFMVKVWWKSLEFRDHHVNTCLVWHQSYAWTLIGQPSPVIRYYLTFRINNWFNFLL